MIAITPWYRRRAERPGGGDETAGSVEATRIMDHRSTPLLELIAEATAASPLSTLEVAHGLIRDRVRPVYALDERVPASRTLRRGFGSCSQRLAILESVARGLGLPTRTRALLIDRSFWAPRFPRSRAILPPVMMLAWPEFGLDGGWRPAAELFGPIGCRGGAPFSNRGSETLFEAAARCAVDWNGIRAGGPYDLSGFVRADLGRFIDRDTAFAAVGQTLCPPALVIADPILRRIAA